MKITIICENFLNYKKESTGHSIFSGAEVLLYEYGKMLVERGDQVTVLQFGDVAAEQEYEGMRVRQLRVPKLAKLSKIGFVRRWHWGGLMLPRSLFHESDWLHFHHHFLAFPFFREYVGGPTVTGFSHGVDWDVDTVYSSRNLRSLKERFSFAMLRAITMRNARAFSKFWCNDRYFLNYITLNRPDLRHRLWHIPNFVDVDIFHPAVSPALEVIERSRGRKIIILPKMPSRDRGTDIALRAIKLMKSKDRFLVIAGESDSSSYFKQLAAEMGIADQVWFTGHKDHFSELPALLAAADVAIIPSPWREATALSLLEGMAMQKPVVSSNIGGLPEVAFDNWNALVRRAVDHEFAAAIETLIENPVYAQQLATRARSWIVAQYSKTAWLERANQFFSR